MQDEVTGRIANTVQSELVVAEARRTADPDVQDFILRGRAATYRQASREKWSEAAGFFRAALALDPLSVEARTWLARALVTDALDYQNDAATVDLRHAEELIEQVLTVSPNSANAHFAKGELLRAQSRPEDAIFEYEAVIALDRNFAAAYCYLGACKLLAGFVDDVIPLEDLAIRLDPRSPVIGSRYFYIGTAHLLRSRLDAAILWLEKARSAYGWFHPVHAGLAAAYALNGETERAVAALGEARKLSDRYSSISRLKAGLEGSGLKYRSSAL